MKNLELRNLIKKNRIHQYEIAEKIGISEFTLCRWLRTELSEERKEIILIAINQILGGD